MIDFTQAPPQDVAAEQAVLGAAMMSREAFNTAADMLTADPPGEEFYRPAHQQIWQSMLDLKTAGQPIDPVTVSDQLARNGVLGDVGERPYIHTLYASVVVATNVSHHATIIKDLHLHRKLIDAATRNLQDALQSLDPVEAILSRAEAQLRTVPTQAADFTTSVMSFDEFCDQPIPPNDWIVPDLLDRGDRLVLTGTEGLGKSILMRQFAVSVAAGFHPFTYKPMPSQTVLYVDCENPKKIMIKTFAEMRDAVRRNRGAMDEKRLWVERLPSGLNLAEASDRLSLQRLVSLINPDLLCIGPAYKLFRGSSKDKDEDLARTVTQALDDIRESVGCALVLEHHSPHGSDGADRAVRPIGSSLWLRWPEFGYGIRAAKGATKQNRLVDLLPWRGSRDERDWPDQLAAGTNFMPWVDASCA